MEWAVVTLIGCILSGWLAYSMGVRSERGRHARWTAIKDAETEVRKRTGGIVLRRLKVER